MSYIRYYGRLARQSGFSVAKCVTLPFERRVAVRSGSYNFAFPLATHPPRPSASEFQRAYHAIRRITFVEAWRCYELRSLLREDRLVLHNLNGHGLIVKR